MADNGGVPIAMPVVMQRIGDLTGDRGADEAHLAALLLTNPVLEASEVALEVRQRLALRPDHSALCMAALTSLATGRGPAAGGP